jgi:hypothetical protein
MVGQMNNEFEKIWKEAVVACSRYYPGICLEGLRKTAKTLSQDSWWCGWFFKQASPEYKSTAVPLDQPVQYVPYNSHLFYIKTDFCASFDEMPWNLSFHKIFILMGISLLFCD